MLFTIHNKLNLAETNCRTRAQHKQLESTSLFCPESLSALPPSLLQPSTHSQNTTIATNSSGPKPQKRKRAVSTSTSSGKRSQDTNDSMPSWAKRKPGRPRSIENNPSTSSKINGINSEDDAIDDNKTKRPRGRPRKDEVASSVTQNSEEEDATSTNMRTAINATPDEPTFEYILQVERDLDIYQLIYNPSEYPHKVITASAFKTLLDEAMTFYENIISNESFFKSLRKQQQSYLQLSLETYQKCQNCLKIIIERDPNNNTPINVQSFLNKEAVDKAFMLLPSDIV